MPTPDPLDTLSISQSGEALGVSSDTIRRMIARGELRAFRVGRSIRIRRTDLARAMRPVTPAFAMAGGE